MKKRTVPIKIGVGISGECLFSRCRDPLNFPDPSSREFAEFFFLDLNMTLFEGVGWFQRFYQFTMFVERR